MALTAVATGLLAAAGLAVLLAPADSGRLGAAAGRVGTSAVVRVRGAPSVLHGPAAASALAGVAVGLLVGPPLGLVAGLALAVTGPRLLGRLEPQAVRAEREQLQQDLPLVLDLLSACLAGGAALPAAAEAVGQAVSGPAGRRLLAVASALAVGSPPAEAWGALAGGDPAARDSDPFGPAARALSRAAEGGAPVAAAVSRLAVQARAEARGRAEQAARRVGVLAVAPLGLCFLPAFVLLGVVPLVIALAGPLLATF